MKVLRLITIAVLVAALFTQCIEDLFPRGGKSPKGMFTVTIENVSEPYMFFQSGVAAIPSGATEAGPALPGHSFSFSFYAGPNHKLSFATMYGWSNDGFYAPDGMGIDLYDSGSPVTGDITSKVMLWDAGTQMNQMPGAGNMHDGADESGIVQLMSAVGDGYDYGMVNTNLKVTLDYDATDMMFMVTVDNLAGSTTPISPVVWVLHTTENPLFEAGMADYGMGLESVAETGNAAMLVDYLAMNSGYVSPIAPGVWAVHHRNDMPIFTENTPDYGIGLEELAEMGDPSVLASSLMYAKYESGVYNTPEGANDPGPLFPGDKYTFSFEGKAGEYLSFASMLGASNDLFFAPGDMGIKLFDGSMAVSGDITDKVLLWDAGTEVNEYPGAQTQANTVEDGDVRIVDDGFMYPDVDKVIKVTIWKN